MINSSEVLPVFTKNASFATIQNSNKPKLSEAEKSRMSRAFHKMLATLPDNVHREMQAISMTNGQLGTVVSLVDKAPTEVATFLKEAFIDPLPFSSMMSDSMKSTIAKQMISLFSFFADKTQINAPQFIDQNAKVERPSLDQVTQEFSR